MKRSQEGKKTLNFLSCGGVWLEVFVSTPFCFKDKYLWGLAASPTILYAGIFMIFLIKNVVKKFMKMKLMHP